jgi:steroid delta-isomerase-like uncharacterized protein
MPAQEHVQVVQAYFQNHDSRYLAETVEFYDMSAAQPLHGRQAVGGFLHLFYYEAFSDAYAEVRNVVAEENGVVIEFVFHGKNAGSLGGAAPTDKVVAVPMCAYYAVAQGQIQLVRLYYDTATMGRQLGLLV